jgi:hypothetical protein
VSSTAYQQEFARRYSEIFPLPGKYIGSDKVGKSS